MEVNTVSPIQARKLGRSHGGQAVVVDYNEVEQCLTHWLETAGVDREIEAKPEQIATFEAGINEAISRAFAPILAKSSRRTSGSHLAHQLLQRLLYHFNRHSCFQSQTLPSYLAAYRDRIEVVWQQWEFSHVNQSLSQTTDIESTLRDRISYDLTPLPSENVRLLREQITAAGYRQLLTITSFEIAAKHGILAEAIRGEHNYSELNASLTRLLQSTFGNHFFSKSASLYAAMLEDVGLSSNLEAYLDSIPWEVLSLINQACLQVRQLEQPLHYIGGLLYSEASYPVRFDDYRAAAQRLNLSDITMNGWNQGIEISAIHRTAVLDQVIVPLVNHDLAEAWNVVLGYDQQRLMSHRAHAAIARSVRAAERAARMSSRTTAKR
ncbi:iron-containing redox enzyme family protein [Oculatella sp. LEGE 06141]|uniref:iron-containing redox enzyme family protein n=1 Tax=Oculatella sp. LEGE 06141 TaxID=1828648 RepID=UPI00187E2D18|nr:iron-containing redox enzyme family protein [Oculatella sp. LEGE 06141]MBE9182382.1 iron-containing redox enzyme family protein [Oculatella sp. LEGE 06141]